MPRFAADGPGVMLPELVGVADLETGVPGLSCCNKPHPHSEATPLWTEGQEWAGLGKGAGREGGTRLPLRCSKLNREKSYLRSLSFSRGNNDVSHEPNYFAI